MAYNEIDFNSKEFKENIRKYEDARRENATVFMDSDDLTDIAEYYYKNGKIDLAVETLDYAVRLFPGSTMPLIFRSRIALLDENSPEIAKRYADDVNDKSDLEYLYLMAEIMLVEISPDKADKYLRERMENIDEDDVPDFIIDVATIFADYNYYDHAEQWLSLSDETDLIDYKEIKGRIASWRGNYEESEHIFEELVDEDPYSNHFWNNLALTQFQQNRIRDSITSSEFSIAIDPKDDEALLNKANGLFSLNHYEEALEYYKRFTSLRPQEDTGYLFQGNALFNLNRIKEAAQMYRKAEEKAHGNQMDLYEIYQDLAFSLSMLGKTDEALRFVDKAERLSVSDKSDLMVLRGHIYLEHNKTRDAQKCFRKAIYMSKFSSTIFMRIAISLYDCNYTNLAYRLFKLISSFKQNKAKDGYAYMALCCKQLGKENEYLENLKKACELNPLEARMVLGHLFPDEIDAEDYYKYASNQH